ncbi:SETD3 [Symbiodinium natans]|uniref:SETD3 protein n=1 Tax=Symbiodinium natans TaxID=878477 RepID=A0A812NTH0_9DINO|nr:SETD3 [Symbiodinium natans]
MHPEGGEEEETWSDFLFWAESHGALGLEQVKIAHVAKEHGPVRGLVAASEVTSPIILPRALLLMANSETELAVELALEKHRMLSGLDSFWSPWIRLLPQKADLQQYHIAYASQEVLDAFAELPVVARTRAWHRSLAQRWDAEAQSWQQQRAAEMGLGELTYDDFLWASTVVKTRVYLPPPMYCFMPLADMMNTEPNPNMDVYDSLETDASNGTEYYGILVRDDCHVCAGQELTQAYRPVDNSERLFRGGFILENNPVPVTRLPAESCKAMMAAGVSSASPLVTSLRRLAAEHAVAPQADSRLAETGEGAET